MSARRLLALVAVVCAGLLAPAAGSLEAQSVFLRLEPTAPAVAPGETFDIDVYIDNPNQLAIGGYQLAFGFDSTRYDLVSVTPPSMIPGAVLTDVFTFNAPPPVGAGFPSCPAWSDGAGVEVISALGLAETFPDGFDGLTGILFRATFQVTGSAGPADLFELVFGSFEGCVYLSAVADVTGTTLATGLIDGSVVISDLAPPQSLSCVDDAAQGLVQLSWSNGEAYDLVRIYRDGALLAELLGVAEDFPDDTVVVGETYTYDIAGVIADEETPRTSCTVTVETFVPVVTGLSCSGAGTTVDLVWANPITYDSIEVHRDGALLETLAGDAIAYTDGAAPGTGSVTYDVIGIQGGTAAPAASCTVDLDTTAFIRGDVDFDGSFNGLVDGIFLLNYAFSMGTEPPCFDAADADDSGAVSGLVDAQYIFGFAFISGPPPPPPYPDPGDDPTPDGLDCSP